MISLSPGYSTGDFTMTELRDAIKSTQGNKATGLDGIPAEVWKRSKNEVVSDLVLWEPKLGKRSVGGQAGTFVDLLEADTRVPRDCLLAEMDERVGWRKRAMGGLLRST